MVPWWAVVGAAAWALPEDALDAVTRDQYRKAARLELVGRCDQALGPYRLVWLHEPAFAPGGLGLARCLEAEGKRGEALDVVRRLDQEPEALASIVRWTRDDSPAEALAAARALQGLEPTVAVWQLEEAALIVGTEPALALRCVDTYLAQLALDGEPATDPRVIEVLWSLREQGYQPEVVPLLRAVADAAPGGALAAEASGRLDRIVVEEQAARLELGADEPLSPSVRAELEAALAMARGGDLGSAARELERLLGLYPRSAETWGARGDLDLRMGRYDQAEQAWRWATVLAPAEAEWHARLGSLLAEGYGGRRHREAAEALERATALRPTWAEAWLRLGRVRQELGQWDLAVDALGRAAALEPGGVVAAEARARGEALARAVPLPQVPTDTDASAPPVADDIWRRYRVAWVYRARGDDPRARAEVDEVLRLAPEWPPALDLSASLLLRAGDPAGAVAAWERSLELEPRQPLVSLALGEVERRRGHLDQARRHLDAAALGGAPDALYLLAALDVQVGDWEHARERLDRYFALSLGGLQEAPAQALRARVDEHFLRRRRWLLGAGLGALASGLALLWRRVRGEPLDTLLARHPATASEVHGLVALFMHEVLKHRTTLLSEMALAVEQGDLHAVAWAAERLFRSGPEASRGAGLPVLRAWRELVGRLQAVGHARGVALALTHKDPVFRELNLAFEALGRTQRPLSRLSGPDPRLARRLLDLDRRLNRVGYDALGRLVQALGSSWVDRERLVALDRAVRAELGLLQGDEGEVVCAEPARVAMPEGALDDVLRNLVRNAHQAVGQGGRVGIFVHREEDLITGLAQGVFAVADTAEGRVDLETWRRSPGTRGLGLALDLVTRWNGSIEVGVRPGYAKELRVRVPLTEVPRGTEGAP